MSIKENIELKSVHEMRVDHMKIEKGMGKAVVWAPEVPYPAVADIRLPDRITHVFVHRGSNPYRFLHESVIIRHDNSFFMGWNNGPTAESEKGTVVRWIRMDDDLNRVTEPRAVAPPLKHETTVWESMQLLSWRGGVWAFLGQVHSHPRDSENAGGLMVVFRFDDASRTWIEQGRTEGFHPLNRPQQTAAGNWVMGGQYNLIQPRVAISKGDDLSAWDVVEIPSTPADRVNYAETSLIADANVITAHVRTTHEDEALYVSESRDGGRTWSRLRAGNLPVTSAKTCAGRLSTGQRYLAFNVRPVDAATSPRDALAVAVSEPEGKHFRKLVLIRNGRPPQTREPGFAKDPQWAYPSVEEYGGNVYISYSVTKEDCCVSILPLDAFR